MAISAAKQSLRNGDSAEIIARKFAGMDNTLCCRQDEPDFYGNNVMVYLNAMLTPIKKNHLEKKTQMGFWN